GILDRYAGSSSQRRQQPLVFLLEVLPAALFRDVEVAEDHIADADWYAEEGLHLRMVGRKAERRRMPGQIVQPQRFRMPDQLSEDPAALGIGTDALDLLCGDTHGEEPGDLVVLTDDAHRGVPRIDEGVRGLYDPVENGLQLQASAHGQNCLEQAPDPIPRRSDRLDPCL